MVGGYRVGRVFQKCGARRYAGAGGLLISSAIDVISSPHPPQLFRLLGLPQASNSTGRSYPYSNEFLKEKVSQKILARSDRFCQGVFVSIYYFGVFPFTDRCVLEISKRLKYARSWKENAKGG